MDFVSPYVSTSTIAWPIAFMIYRKAYLRGISATSTIFQAKPN